MPLFPTGSFREPTLYQTWMLTTGALGSSTKSTLSPFVSVASKTRSARLAADADWWVGRNNASTKTAAHNGRRRRPQLLHFFSIIFPPLKEVPPVPASGIGHDMGYTPGDR